MELQLFTTQDGRLLSWEKFLRHPLGQLYATIPFQRYAKLLSYQAPKTGPKPWFNLQGGIGLQILKSYYGYSDAKLIDQLNENKMMQYFCGVNLKASESIRDRGIVSRWRIILGKELNLPQTFVGLQKANADYWKKQLEQTDANLADATCYESHVRYPTDVKLLWESIDYLHGQIKIICKYIRIPRPKSKYKDQKKKYQAYQTSRKKSYKKTRQIKRRLLYLLNKFLNFMPGLISELKQKEETQLIKCRLKSNFFNRLSVIKKVYGQQQLHFDYPKAKIEDRIISLAKPYLRPIIRGKETKRVEFGMKVHEMQVDGINFIEHWSFNAFHEGIRMKKTLWKHQFLFGKKVSLFGGDRIYATNKNRKYCSQQSIQTCFDPKGRPPQDSTLRKHKKQLRSLIGKERATRLEGSFGNKKNHYLLGRIKARIFCTELAWVFFGNLTANAVAMVKRWKPPDEEGA